MRRSLQDNLKIDVIKFNPKKIDKGVSLNRVKGEAIGTVILPIPSAVQDGNKTDWGSGSMNPVQMAAANILSLH